ncbi:MAG: hypothetical protein E6J50_04850 [Chloroflexi bacterium]|nr:MAG: hypothetical protein E6J50_04850 [Chloroflexota bacterium]
MADEQLIRDRAGSYHTEDGRFAVENDGRWNVRDEQEHDELGLPRVLGPFATLDAAREAIAEARARRVVKLPKKRR